MNRINDFTENPDSLLEFGLKRHDEETTDSLRLVWYEKNIYQTHSPLNYILQVEFELLLSDDPFVSYSDNCDYSFVGVYLRIINRGVSYHETSQNESIEIKEVDKIELNIGSISELVLFSKMFSK